MSQPFHHFYGFYFMLWFDVLEDFNTLAVYKIVQKSVKGINTTTKMCFYKLLFTHQYENSINQQQCFVNIENFSFHPRLQFPY